MTHTIETAFRSWRERLHLNQTAAARSLGRSRRQVYAYDTGAEDVPRVVRLAMIALEDHPELIKFADGSDVPDDEILRNPANPHIGSSFEDFLIGRG